MKHLLTKISLFALGALTSVGLYSGDVSASQIQGIKTLEITETTPLYLTQHTISSSNLADAQSGWHYSHSSHASHYSHESHSSHYSHYSSWR